MNIPNPTIALIDVDQICFASAVMAEGLEMKTSHILQCAKQMITKRKAEVLKLCPTVKQFKLFLSHERNFRKLLDTEVPYKGNRGEKPEALPLVRNYFKKLGARSMAYLEADDHTAMNHYASHKDGSYRTVLVDQDKDLDQIVGHRIVPSLSRQGELIREAKYRFIDYREATESFYSQLLTGDSTDNIMGLVGVGKKKAEEMLSGWSCEQDLYARVLDTYIETYGELCITDIVRLIIERGQLLYMKRFPNDLWLPPRQDE